jgi:rhodanese-related sulfurtransferase
VNEATSVSLAQEMMKKGYKKVYALKGGWTEWASAKYPVEPKKAK